MLTVRSATVSDSFISIIPATIIVTCINLVAWGGLIYLFILLIKALRKYLKSEPVRKETAAVRRSLGEALKAHRTACKMTQEFVAEHLGVSRQAVSKWENDLAFPDVSNLIKLADLLDTDIEYLATGRRTYGRRPPVVITTTELVEKVVEVPVVQTVESVVERIVEKPVVKTIEKPVFKKVYRNRYIRSKTEYLIVGGSCFILGLLFGLLL